MVKDRTNRLIIMTLYFLNTVNPDVYNTRLHAKIQKASHKNKTSMPISILLQKLENPENSKFSDFMKENICAKFSEGRQKLTKRTRDLIIFLK